MPRLSNMNSDYDEDQDMNGIQEDDEEVFRDEAPQITSKDMRELQEAEPTVVTKQENR